MIKRLTLVSSLALAVSVAMPAVAAEEVSVDSVVATINGTDITVGHMIVARATLPEQYQQMDANVLYNGILNQLIQQEALAQSVKTDTPSHVLLSLENEKRSLMAAEAIEAFMEDSVTDAAVKEAYNAQYANAEQGDEYNASHILVETEEEAKELVEALASGADFAELAKEKSTGPSGPGGGSLGWFAKGAMVAPFEEAVLALKVDEVSAPVQTQFGWHVIKLNDTRPLEAPEFEDVAAELRLQLQRDAVDAHVQALTDAAEVSTFEIEGLEPSIIENLDLVRN